MQVSLEQAGFFASISEIISYTTLTTQTQSILTVAFNPNRGSSTLAFGTTDNLVHLWNTDTTSHQRTLRGHTAYVLGVAFSPDGNTLASGDANGTVRVWNARTGNLNTLCTDIRFGPRYCF